MLLRAAISLIALALAAGCSPDALGTYSAPSNGVAGVDPALQPYLAQLVQDSRSVLTSSWAPTAVNMGFQALGFNVTDGGVNGLCTLSDASSPTVSIDPTYWSVASDAQKENLVFHELGHCLLSRVHVTTLNADGTPASMMFPYTLAGSIYLQNHAEYIAELFGASPLFSVNHSMALPQATSVKVQIAYSGPDLNVNCAGD